MFVPKQLTRVNQRYDISLYAQVKIDILGLMGLLQMTGFTILKILKVRAVMKMSSVHIW